MSRQTQRRSGGCLTALLKFMIILILVLAIIAGVLYFFGDMIRERTTAFVSEKVTEQITDQIIDEVSTNTGLDTEEIQNAIDQIDEEDQQTITDIVSDHLDANTASDVSTYIQNQDIDGLMQYAQENLSSDEYEKLYSLYEKYGGQ